MSCEGDLLLFQTLVELGADVNADDEGGKMTFLFAAMLGHAEIVDFLVGKCAAPLSQKCWVYLPCR